MEQPPKHSIRGLPPPYKGVAYTQGPQQSASEFKTSVSTTAGGNTKFGNDCSGFVSMCWKLPKRYTTTTFASDANSAGGYVDALGDTTTIETVPILYGDALNASGNHIVLVKEKIPSGIKVHEQSPPTARLYEYSYSYFRSNKYKPIRRRSMNETIYSGYLSN